MPNLLRRCVLLLALVVVCKHSFATQLPSEIMQSADNLSMVGASINNCFENKEYKILSTSQAMRLLETSLQIEEIVTKIQNHYRTTNLLPAYHVAVVGYMKSNSIKQQTIQQYKSLCSNAFIDSVETFVKQSDRKIIDYLANQRRK
jgi:hypothetical protein